MTTIQASAEVVALAGSCLEGSLNHYDIGGELGAATRVDLEVTWRPASTPASDVRILGSANIEPPDGDGWKGYIEAKLDIDGHRMICEMDVPEGYVDEDQEEPWMNWVSSNVEALFESRPGCRAVCRRFGG